LLGSFPRKQEMTYTDQEVNWDLLSSMTLIQTRFLSMMKPLFLANLEEKKNCNRNICGQWENTSLQRWKQSLIKLHKDIFGFIYVLSTRFYEPRYWWWIPFIYAAFLFPWCTGMISVGVCRSLFTKMAVNAQCAVCYLLIKTGHKMIHTTFKMHT